MKVGALIRVRGVLWVAVGCAAAWATRAEDAPRRLESGRPVVSRATRAAVWNEPRADSPDLLLWFERAVPDDETARRDDRSVVDDEDPSDELIEELLEFLAPDEPEIEPESIAPLPAFVTAEEDSRAAMRPGSGGL